MLHGWPSSFVQMLPIAPLLTTGVNPFHVVVISLPGYTLANALNDSPAGLAAWILEKFHRWSDCRGDLDSVFDRDDLLSNLTIYWATRTIGSSMRLYYETATAPPPATAVSKSQPAWPCPAPTCSPLHANGSNGSSTSSTGPTSPEAATSSNGKSPPHRRRPTYLLQLPPTQLKKHPPLNPAHPSQLSRQLPPGIRCR
jgi:hypothetical protein